MKKIILGPKAARPGDFIKWILLGLILPFLNCSKDNNSKSPYTLDQEIFFTLETGSAIYKTNGYYRTETPEINGGPTLYVQKSLDSTGAPIVEITISIKDQVQDGIVNGTSLATFFSVGNFEGEIRMQKSGNETTGTYSSLKGETYTNYFDVLENRVLKRFTADSVGLYFNIVTETKHTNGKNVVKGNFSCNLVEGNDKTLIPAHGSFRLYKI